MKNTISHTGKAAVFVRGFMTKYSELTEAKKEAPLRSCQDAGLHAVQALDEDISVAYISRLARELVDDGVVTKKKKGRKYFMGPGVKTDLFLDWLDDNPDWGAEIEDDAIVEVKEKMEILEFMNRNKAVLISSDDPMPKAQYSFLMKQFKEGKLDMVFVDADYTPYIRPSEPTEDDEDQFGQPIYTWVMDHVYGLDGFSVDSDD